LSFVALLLRIYLLQRIYLILFRYLIGGCDPGTEFFTLHLPFSSGTRDEHDQGNVAIDHDNDDDDDDDDSVEQTFCHGERGVGGRIDLWVIGNPNVVNLGKLVSTSFPRDLLLFPPRMSRKRIFASTVYSCLLTVRANSI